MKRIIFNISILVFLISCEKTKEQNRADEFMSKVKSETYNDMFLPDFEPDDISTLLSYRDNKTILKKFPTNPISSMIGDSVTIGNIALWTIESIRISELNGDTSEFKRFPSLNPMICDTLHRQTGRFILQDSVSKRYYNWWNNSNLLLNKKLRTNPLKGSNLIWF
jgi:hypothetical protein